MELQYTSSITIWTRSPISSLSPQLLNTYIMKHIELYKSTRHNFISKAFMMSVTETHGALLRDRILQGVLHSLLDLSLASLVVAFSMRVIPSHAKES